MERLKVHKDKKPRKYLSKKVTTIIIAVLAVIVATAIILIFRPTYISPSENTSRRIAESYFNRETTLEDYKIESAATVFFDSDNYVKTNCSVKPTQKAFAKWNDGNGKEYESGWIINKSIFIRYWKIGNVYFIGINVNHGI